MTFDIIDVTQAEVDEMPVIKQKLIRTAQQKKDELLRKLNDNLAELGLMVSGNNVLYSSIYSQSAAQLRNDYDEDVAIIKEQLEYNLSINESSNDGETGDTDTDDSPYAVDYELSYIERYIIVRDYYLSIEDPNERITLLQADTVAQDYLGTYYSTLFDYLMTLT